MWPVRWIPMAEKSSANAVSGQQRDARVRSVARSARLRSRRAVRQRQPLPCIGEAREIDPAGVVLDACVPEPEAPASVGVGVDEGRLEREHDFVSARRMLVTVSSRRPAIGSPSSSRQSRRNASAALAELDGSAERPPAPDVAVVAAIRCSSHLRLHHYRVLTTCRHANSVTVPASLSSRISRSKYWHVGSEPVRALIEARHSGPCATSAAARDFQR
jgi:hypothetical protein